MRLLVMSSLLALMTLVPACSSNTSSGTGGATTDEYLMVIPGTDQLAITQGDTLLTTTSDQPLGTVSQAVVGETSDTQKEVDAIRLLVNKMVSDTKAVISSVTASVTSTAITVGGRTCKRWEFIDKSIQWQLVSCKLTASRSEEDHSDGGTGDDAGVVSAGTYEFFLRGKPDTAAGSYRMVFGGRGKGLPSFNDKARGHGWVGFDLDALKVLTGENLGGKIAIGYRASGKVRQLNLGFSGVTSATTTQPFDALYAFHHVVGNGSWLRNVVKGDYFKVDGLKLVPGQDTKVDTIRRIVGWNREGAARAFLAVCGETVKDAFTRRCVLGRQCWGANGLVTFESWGSAPWDSTCATVLAPSDAETEPGEERELEREGTKPEKGDDHVDGPQDEGSFRGPKMDEPGPDHDE
ncbi:MAG: hypothetical protein WCI05_03690 [Myxococcales bacterium]